MASPRSSPTGPAEPVHGALFWHDNGWRARVLKNPDDDGWAVEMHRDGDPEPALIGPWTMGRDKRNPKPLDVSAFNTLVKTAAEVIRRHEQQLHATLHREVTVTASGDGTRWTVTLDIVPGEDDAHALLVARDAAGEETACLRVDATFRLTAGTATAWVDSGFRKPA